MNTESVDITEFVEIVLMQKCYFLMIGTISARKSYHFGNFSGQRIRQRSFVTFSDNAVLYPYLDRHHLDLGSYNRILVSNFEIRFQLSFIYSFYHLFIYSSILSSIQLFVHLLLLHTFIHSFFPTLQCFLNEIFYRSFDGQDHLVLADMGCRNTVFSAQAQSGTSPPLSLSLSPYLSIFLSPSPSTSISLTTSSTLFLYLLPSLYILLLIYICNCISISTCIYISVSLSHSLSFFPFYLSIFLYLFFSISFSSSLPICISLFVP